jgi:hypothetical protein
MKAFSCWMLVVLIAGAALLSGCLSARRVAVDLEGKARDPFAETNVAATVLIFVSNDCPIANRYVPEIRRLEDAFAKRGVSFWLVHADPEETAAEIREHDRKFGVTLRVLRDPEHRLAELAQAHVTPTAALFTSGKALVYHGRIDDRVVDLGRERAEPGQRDLVEALEAVLAGRAVANPVTTAVGCHIPGGR